MKSNTILRLNKTYIQVLKHPKTFVNHKWTYETENREVILMAVIGIHAMVRRKGCTPYVCRVKELSEVQA